MNPYFLIVLAACALSAAALAGAVAGPVGGGKKPHDRPLLRGTWTCASAVVDGRALADATAKKLRLTLTDQRYRTEREDEVLFDSTYRLDPTSDPKGIEMVGTEGDAAGEPALGIYALEDDGKTLKICYVMPGRPRPTRFESAPGSGAYLVTWKREASPKPGAGERAEG